MKNKLTLMSAIVAGLVSIAGSVQAIPVNGTVNMGGNITLDTSSLLTATSAAFNTPAGIVSGGTGSYVSVVPFTTTVNFSGFNIVLGNQAIAPLWSFVYLLNTYTFDLSSINTITRASDQLFIAGTGIVNITGGLYDATSANWTFTITDSSKGGSSAFQFGFSSSDTATVPDGGMTVMLLGVALTGIFLIRKQVQA